MAENENENFQYNPDANYDEATIAQHQQIEKDIAENQPLISDRLKFDGLEQEYLSDPIYFKKIKDISTKYSYFRRTRGDGNCFYRGFGFAYLEKILKNKDEVRRFRDVVIKCKDHLLEIGYPQFTLEDFHDTFMNVLEQVENECSLKELLEVFNDQNYSNFLVVYLRLLVSGHLQKEEEFYQNFVDGLRTIKEFCGQEVEPMGKESDHIHITALTTALQIPIRVVYMDRGDTLTSIDFLEGKTPMICLLYRPGHYDILYDD